MGPPDRFFAGVQGGPIAMLGLYCAFVGAQVSRFVPMGRNHITSRRGAVAADARLGAIALRKGSAIATPPAPRSSVRRCIGLTMVVLMAQLLPATSGNRRRRS